MTHLSFIQSALEESSKIANEKFGHVSGTIKDGDSNQILTQADLEIGKYIIERINKEFPDYNSIDEETGTIDNGSAFTWVIDPIDGTSNFAHGVPLYGIMIGLLQDATPIAGGIAFPAFQEICTAEKGKGTYLKGEKLHVTGEQKLINTLIAYGIDAYQKEPEKTYEETKLLGSIILACRNFRTSNSVFDLLMVAKGSYGGILNRTSKIWDNVAMQIVIEEAEGLYTDFFGKPMDYSKPLTKITQNYTFCAASPGLHKQLQEIIHSK